MRPESGRGVAAAPPNAASARAARAPRARRPRPAARRAARRRGRRRRRRRRPRGRPRARPPPPVRPVRERERGGGRVGAAEQRAEARRGRGRARARARRGVGRGRHDDVERAPRPPAVRGGVEQPRARRARRSGSTRRRRPRRRPAAPRRPAPRRRVAARQRHPSVVASPFGRRSRRCTRGRHGPRLPRGGGGRRLAGRSRRGRGGGAGSSAASPVKNRAICGCPSGPKSRCTAVRNRVVRYRYGTSTITCDGAFSSLRRDRYRCLTVAIGPSTFYRYACALESQRYELVITSSD